MQSTGFRRFYLQYRSNILLILFIISIKIIASNPLWVEVVYSTGVYPAISGLLRLITGWVPFSIGDALYFLAGIGLVWLLIRFIRHLIRHKQNFIKHFPFRISLQYILLIYIIFNVLWGINYNRQGISKQLDLDIKPYTLNDLKNIQTILLTQVNTCKNAQLKQVVSYPNNYDLFKRAKECYYVAQKSYPFLNYYPGSLKSSLYGKMGNYLGFSGYYNPFSGEAQVNTTIPPFLLPYTTCHEMGHQLGYAKEMEANFVGYLTATSGTDTLFKYSAYLDLYVYATREVAIYDSNYAKASFKQLLPSVKEDLAEVRKFWIRHQNPIEPVITWLYGNYLKANQQPRGMQSYNEVTADLIAYYKKFGKI